MNSVKIPSCIDLSAIYGFDSVLDDLIQTSSYILGGFKLIITFDLSIDSLRIILFYQNNIILDFYTEDLSSVITDDQGEFISFVTKGKNITIKLFPYISLDFYDF